MIKSLLIANRGEIACRIMRTCRELGIRTIAVYSDADAGAKHVREADEAIHIGPSPATESYLRGEKIIEAAKKAGADAIHPGYGFLSENADFAETVKSADIIWVGPDPSTIREMGLKDEAKRIAEEAGVPVLPGYRGADQSLESLKAAAKDIGFPLLIKAVAGGGGRGIREVGKLGELKDQLDSAQREAKSAFGDDRVMLEKLVTQPRHIEVQVFGDSHGNVVHLFERDCSLQRRRQKVIEEAPAPGMPDQVRAKMTAAAVSLAKATGYKGAGTVEFIVDGSGPLTVDSFWFLEMNTRLQVEHPVTEMITGFDLVDWQLRVAAGEKIPVKQKEIAINGHAFEARICAEDPSQDFRPGAGEIAVFDAPYGVREDGGFEAGDTVPPDYDSMISKAIVHGATREDALEELVGVLSSTELYPITHNVGFLRRCAAHNDFAAGEHHVNWIAELGETLTHAPEPIRNAALSAVAQIELIPTGDDPWEVTDGWRSNSPNRRTVALAVGDEVTLVDCAEDEPFLHRGLVTELGAHRYGVTVDGQSFIVSRPDYDAVADALEAGDDVKAPMPGKLLSVLVTAGETVTQGQPLAVLEAMKMEHTLSSPRDGVVASVIGAAGGQVSEGVLLIQLEPDDD